MLTCYYGPWQQKMIEHILLNSNHITLNKNTPTCLPPNQTQQPTVPNITTVPADLHDCTNWQTIHSLTSNHLPLHTTLSKNYKTNSHFTETITNYQKANLPLHV